MPRGRHRHSPPLHRLLPPSAIAGVSLVCAFGPWVFSEPTALRSLAAAAAATAVGGAVVMRRWDTQAGKRVAELTRARASDEWRHEERVAELEADLEEARELRAKLEQRLRAKRAELQGLRNEHAALLRRYATAETERASALEGRRLLETGSAAPARELEAAPERRAKGATGAAEQRPKTPSVFSPEGARLFLLAGAALSRLNGGGAAGEGAARAVPGQPGGGTGTGPVREDEAQGRLPAAGGHRSAAADPADRPARRPAGHFTVPTAAAVVPPAPARRPAAEGGFDFFGTKNQKKPAPRPALDTVHNEDLADVVGQEALTLHKAEAEARFKPADDESPRAGQVIDLTAHDETEPIDVQGLRSAAS
ncbi:hypothetical protein ACIBAI_23195 [Streptomyces sp. NPDC051041]|uniref:hypothetical protein n=1 Tax=Streptomyces sp. NPDC051041 TaxID=3365640 RepID=UPI0037947F53